MVNRIKLFLVEVRHLDVFQTSRAYLDLEENIACIFPNKRVRKLETPTFSLSWYYLHLFHRSVNL